MIRHETKMHLSGSSEGRGIEITVTVVGSAQTIHTATSTANYHDEVRLYAYNAGDNPVAVTLLIGDTTSPDDYFQVSVPGKAGHFPLLDSQFMEAGDILKAYAATANVIILRGDVLRVGQQQ